MNILSIQQREGAFLQRYFINNEQFNENDVVISGDDYHHITRVMRMDVGGKIYCCNNNGQTAVCKIAKITSSTVLASIVEWVKESSEMPVKVDIASGLPKGDKLEYIIQKGTELGAHSFIPFIAARSIVKWDLKKANKKIDRWTKIAKEASEQSHRHRIPEVHQPFSLQKLIDHSKEYDYKLVAYEEEAKRGERSNLATVLTDLKQDQSLLVVFGPEGGLTDHEVSLLKENGFLACSFGPRILRTETAPLYLLAAVSYQIELLLR